MEHQEQLGKIQAAGAVGKNSSSTIGPFAGPIPIPLQYWSNLFLCNTGKML